MPVVVGSVTVGADCAPGPVQTDGATVGATGATVLRQSSPDFGSTVTVTLPGLVSR